MEKQTRKFAACDLLITTSNKTFVVIRMLLTPVVIIIVFFCFVLFVFVIETDHKYSHDYKMQQQYMKRFMNNNDKSDDGLQ